MMSTESDAGGYSEHSGNISRVVFLCQDGKTPSEVHSVPIGTAPATYAQSWNERLERNGSGAKPYRIESSHEPSLNRGFVTADEAKSSNIEKMGKPLGEIYSALWQEVALIHVRWNEYTALFGTNPKRIDVLNEAAPYFFRMLQDELWDTTLLNLARLTDPARSPGKDVRKNLSLNSMVDLINDDTLKIEIDALLVKASELTSFARDWRNRRIAHRDLKLALEQPTTALATGSRAQVTEALNAIEKVMNAVSGHYLASETPFGFARPLGGALSLLETIDNGLHFEAGRQKRLENGVLLAEDFRQNDWL